MSVAMQSPILSSPYRLPLIKSNSGGDLVTGIIEKFESFSVTDKHEERERFERQMSKMKAALDRAQMAREEAESEASKLREKLLDVQDERQKEKGALRERAQDYEKKYDKAKERFKMQRAKHEDAMQKVQKDHLEIEKRHWRSMAAAEEEMQWERRLRTDANELLVFLELESHFKSISRPSTPPKSLKRVDSLTVLAIRSLLTEEPITCEGPSMSHANSRAQAEQEQGADPAVSGRPSSVQEHKPTTRATRPEAAYKEHRPIIMATRSEPAVQSRRPLQPLPSDLTPPCDLARPSDSAICDDEDDDKTTPPPTTATPLRQTKFVPVHFGDDKENQTPIQIHDAAVLDAPLTIDRAAALAAIKYRRGRAKSFMNAQSTPKKLEMLDRRDMSAPPLVTMTVGRPK